MRPRRCNSNLQSQRTHGSMMRTLAGDGSCRSSEKKMASALEFTRRSQAVNAPLGRMEFILFVLRRCHHGSGDWSRSPSDGSGAS